MLSYLLGLIQEFERTHGRVSVLVSLNAQHMKYLLQECPDLVCNDEPFPFGFRISVVPKDELAHPVVSVLPVMRTTGERSCFPLNNRLARSPQRESLTSAVTRHLLHQ